jgi:hypothetical protein
MKISIRLFRIVWAIVVIPVIFYIAIPLFIKGLQKLLTGKWFIGLPLLSLFFVGIFGISLIGSRLHRKIRDNEDLN